MKPPLFWQKPPALLSTLLSPLGWLYNRIVNGRLNRISPQKMSVPVMCVGNLSLGGTGKTPTVIALSQLIRSWGYTPHILSRGYGGTLSTKNPLRVNPLLHKAQEVGDEPLLLAAHAPTWIGTDRVASAREAISQGATFLIMDDGLQNPHLQQDLKIAVFDGKLPFENTCVFPAGPLRQSLASGLSRTDIILLIDFPDIPAWIKDNPSFRGRIISATFHTSQKSKPLTEYIAFAGIGHPEKFFQTLRQQGFLLHKTISFPDHHVYTERDLHNLLEEVKKSDTSYRLITTEKDAIKLPTSFKEQCDILYITLELINHKDIEMLRELIYRVN